jgi:hypothetical protein
MNAIADLLREAAGVPSAGRTGGIAPPAAPPPSAPIVPPASPRPPRDGWDDDEQLFSFGDPARDAFCIRDSLAGVSVFGGTGSGKSSGSGALIAHTYLRAGYGLLVLCVKSDEPEVWRRYAAATGRSDDLIFFGSDDHSFFNFLDYEARRKGAGSGLTENLIQLFIEMAATGSGESAGAKGDDPFWDRAMRSLIRNLLDLLLLAKSPVTLAAMFDILRSAPHDLSRTNSNSWRDESLCYRLIGEAEAAAKDSASAHDLAQVKAFWLTEFPSMPDKTRGSVVELFRTMAEALLRGKVRTLFCESSTVIPEHVLAGKILVVDLPVKQWGEVGRYAGVLWKFCLQKAIERRIDNADGRARPVAIWADEFQFFISKSDFLFQTTARSSRAATVYLTQTRSGLMASLGSDSSGTARIDALLGNLDTKIFHANSDRETNQWAADTVGKDIIELESNQTGNNFSIGGSTSFSNNTGNSRNQQIDYRLQPRQFTELKKGGPQNNLIVEAIVYQTGRRWSSGETWLKTRFRQGAGLDSQPKAPPRPVLAAPGTRKLPRLVIFACVLIGLCGMLKMFGLLVQAAERK